MERNTTTNTFRIGSIFGVTIAVHFTWFVIFALITFSMTGTFAASFPGLPQAAHLLIGLAASLLFFGSVLFHEMAHSLMAIRSGKPVRSITLFIFGGVSEIGKEADRPGEEIRIALIGPVSSYFLAAFFGGVWLLSRGGAPVIGEVSKWLSAVNLILGTFNLLPGIPLDGGRVLRGIVWSVTGDKDRATRVAVGAGRTIGYLMIMGGVFMAFRLNQLFNDVLATPRDEWGRTSVQAAMRRADQIYSVSHDTELEDALRLMDEKNIAQIPVMLDGRLLGMIGRDHLIRLIINRATLA